MLGLLIGFTLAMAIDRYDARRDVLIDEANAIGTLNLRAGLLDPPVCDDLRASLQAYTDARVELAGSVSDLEELNAMLKMSEALQTKVWSSVERAGTGDISNAKMATLITSANKLIDLHETRVASIENYLPASLLLLLLGAAALAAYFLAWSFGAAGHNGRAAVLMLGFLVVTVLFLIMDINRPQRGAFQVGGQSLERVQESIAETVEP